MPTVRRVMSSNSGDEPPGKLVVFASMQSVVAASQ
jgi:hypothetical protein